MCTHPSFNPLAAAHGVTYWDRTVQLEGRDQHDSPHDRRRSSRNTIPGNFDHGRYRVASLCSPFRLLTAVADGDDGDW
eukprot:scaffold17722_cov121-Isochrysis_galbana.AAC.2